MAVYGGYSVSTEASWVGSIRRVRGCWRLETPVSFCALRELRLGELPSLELQCYGSSYPYSRHSKQNKE